MLQIYVAWYQLISSHPTSCIAACWGLGDDPFPQTGPTHSTGAGGGLSLFYLYPMPILLSLCYLIWYSFQYLILTYILVTYFSIHASLARNQLSSSYPTSCSAAGWKLDDPHPFPGPTHSTGGRGGWWVMTMTMAGGVGGGPGTWNIYIDIYHTWILWVFNINTPSLDRSYINTQGPNLYFWRSQPSPKTRPEFQSKQGSGVGSGYALEVQPPFFIGWFPNHHCFSRDLSSSKRNHHF